MLRSGPDMAGKRFKPSGPNIKEKDRHTDVLKVRCAPELAAQARAFSAARGVTLAQILKAGLDSLAVPQEEQCSHCFGTGDRRGFDK